VQRLRAALTSIDWSRKERTNQALDVSLEIDPGLDPATNVVSGCNYPKLLVGRDRLAYLRLTNVNSRNSTA
jgi:hypothetical protein